MGWADQATEELSRAGYRRGGARKAVIDLLAQQSCALSVPEIELRLRSGSRTVGRASVYRVLEELEGLGLVDRLMVDGGVARFEPIYPDGEAHHHHLVCSHCGELVPFRDEELERVIERVSARVEFHVAEHDITLRGACAACRAAPVPAGT